MERLPIVVKTKPEAEPIVPAASCSYEKEAIPQAIPQLAKKMPGQAEANRASFNEASLHVGNSDKLAWFK